MSEPKSIIQRIGKHEYRCSRCGIKIPEPSNGAWGARCPGCDLEYDHIASAEQQYAWYLAHPSKPRFELNSYIVYGHLYRGENGERCCTCVAWYDTYGNFWNMRGGKEYMQRTGDIYPCHSYFSLERLIADTKSLYHDDQLFFKECDPYTM